MSNGVCILAQNNDDTNYVEQTYALALSILATSPNTNISIVTDDTIPSTYKAVFDQIISIPWIDSASESSWKIENRWKLYHVTPYDNTLVFDADMLVLDNIDLIWEPTTTPFMFTNKVYTYRNELVTSRYYRKTFDSNNLPNIYTGMYKFSKSEATKEFFILLELIMKNWRTFYEKYAPINMQDWNSVDLSAAIALKILDSNPKNELSFIHMKPHAQHWQHVPNKWTDSLQVDFSDDKLYIGGYKQSGILHYVEDEFLTSDMIKWLEERV